MNELIDDVLYFILKCFDHPIDICMINAASKKLYYLSNSEHIWKYYFDCLYQKNDVLVGLTYRHCYQKCHVVSSLIREKNFKISLDQMFKKTYLDIGSSSQLSKACNLTNLLKIINVYLQ